jgi:hypothetical protein
MRTCSASPLSRVKQSETGAIDMDRVTVKWNRETSHKIISRSTGPSLVCPNWAISGKYNLLPGRTADSDDWLEPGEQFELLLCPQGDSPKPYCSFQHPASHESGQILPHPRQIPKKYLPRTALTHPVHQTAPPRIRQVLRGNIDKWGIFTAFLIGVNSVAQ